MDARRLFRLNSGLLVALLAATCATGCGTLHGFRSDPSTPQLPDPGKSDFVPNAAPNPDPPPAAFPGGTVVASGGSGVPAPANPPLPYIPQVGQLPGAGDPVPPMQSPRPLAQPLPQPQPLPQSQQGGLPVPPGTNPNAAPGTPGGPTAFADPHRRMMPTVTGGRLELNPWEVPADRVVELSKQLEFAQAQNHDLVARIKDLETQGLGREQAARGGDARDRGRDVRRREDPRRPAGRRSACSRTRSRSWRPRTSNFLRSDDRRLHKLLPPEEK